MPWLDEADVGGALGVSPFRMTAEDVPEPVEPTTLETITAAFRVDNDVVNATNALARQYTFEPDPDGHDPNPLIDETEFATEDRADFLDSQSEAETRSIIERKRAERADRELLDRAGWAGVAAQIGAGILSPTVLMPGGFAITGAVRAGRVSRGVIEVGAAATVATAAQEAVLQGSQLERTAAESIGAVAGAAVIGGLLGGLGGALGRETTEQLGARLEVDMAGEELAPAPYQPGAQAQGAGAAAAETGPQGDSRPVGTFGVNEFLGAIRFGPVNVMQTSPFEATRRFARYAEASLPVKATDEGIAQTDVGNVESLAKMYKGPMVAAFREVNDSFRAYRRAGGALRHGPFRERVSQAVRNGAVDTEGDVNVTAAARAIKKYNDYMAREAQDVGLLDEELTVLGAKGWLHRSYNRNVMAARSGEFKEILVRNLVKQRDARIKGKEQMRRKVAAQHATIVRAADDGDEAAIAELNKLTKIYKTPAMGLPDDYGLEDFFRGKLELADLLKDDGDELVKMDDAYIRDVLVEDIYAKLMGFGTGTANFNVVSEVGSSALKARVLNVPDSEIAEFLDNDAFRVLERYSRTMGADIAMARAFPGDPTLKNLIREIREQAEASKTADMSEKQRAAITRRAERDVIHVEAFRDRLRGTYGIPGDADGVMTRGIETLKQANYMRLLGGMTLSALPDIGSVMMRLGFRRFFGTGVKAILSPSFGKRLGAANTEALRRGAEIVVHTRALDLANIFEEVGRHSKFERGMKWASDRFGLLSLMSYWNEGLKQMAATMAVRAHTDAMLALAAGRATQKQVRHLAEASIDANDAREIVEMMKAGGGFEMDGHWWPESSKWEGARGRRLRSLFAAAVIRDVDHAVVSPGNERHLWFNNNVGSIFLQFKTFAAAATQRVMLSGLARKDAEALNGVAVMVVMGGIAAATKERLRGKDPTAWSAEKWMHEAVDQSGIIAAASEVANTSDKIFGVGPSMLTGEPVSRYRSRNWAGTFFGPSADAIADIYELTQSVSRSDNNFTDADIRRIRKLLPMQNLFYLRRLFDEGEKVFTEESSP